ncbi:MAG: nuclear transport factor 2 family protein [Pseudomonadota bacterium]
MKDFAAEWEAAWNAHDLDRILSHYAEDVVFRSAKAVATVGTGVIEGKAALREYWAAALTRQPDLAFSVIEVFEGHGMLVILYVNQVGRRATETLRFGADGLVVEASACHGEGAFT